MEEGGSQEALGLCARESRATLIGHLLEVSPVQGTVSLPPLHEDSPGDSEPAPPTNSAQRPTHFPGSVRTSPFLAPPGPRLPMPSHHSPCGF